MDLNLGYDYINNMAETDSLQGSVIVPGALIEHTAGMALHAIVNMDALTVIFEHVTAADDFNTADLQFNGAKASPAATNIEIAYTLDMAGREMTIALAHQSTSDMDTASIGLPESVNLLSVSTTVADDVALAVEFKNASDYEKADNGSGESGSTVTAQLAVEF